MKVLIEAHALEKLLGPMVKQAPFVAQKAINDTLFQARKDQLQKMKTSIHLGATNWTKRGLRYDKAKKNYLQGTLYFHPNRPYMKTIIEGGVVRPKQGQERLVAPVKGKIRLTKYGNIGKGRVRSLANKPNYFVGKPGNSRDEDKSGLYKIKGRGKNKKLERIAYINQKSRKQKKTYRGPEFAQTYIKKRLQRNIIRAARRAIDTARY
jgi:hypothetical protein